MLLLNLCSQGGVQPARTSLASEALVHQSGRNLTDVLQASLQILFVCLTKQKWAEPTLAEKQNGNYALSAASGAAAAPSPETFAPGAGFLPARAGAIIMII